MGEEGGTGGEIEKKGRFLQIAPLDKAA